MDPLLLLVVKAGLEPTTSILPQLTLLTGRMHPLTAFRLLTSTLSGFDAGSFPSLLT